MIKAIIFDCFGVLTTDAWRAFLESLPAGVDIEAARELNHAVDAGLITQAEFLSGVKEATGFEPPDIRVMTSGQLVKNAELLDYIRELKATYVIGILSNISNNWIREHLLSKEDQKLFDAMVFSYEVGLTKPDPRVYQETCDRLGVEREEAIMVDDIDRYCQAAKDLDMQAIVYENFPQFKRELAAILSHS